jgi:acetyl esterase/lipase
MATAAETESAAASGTPDVQWSGRPSRRSLLFAWAMRLMLRPLIALSAAISALGIRLGPRGIEMWPVWTWFHLVGDRLGMLAPLRSGTVTERIRLADCRADYVRAAGVRTQGRAVLYFHGGGFVTGGLGTYRRFASILSATTDATVLNVGYRLLPRSPIAHAIEDGVAGYRQLLDDGYQPGEIVLGGDSAGGGLAVLVAHAIPQHGLPRPAGIVALSPWADLDVTDKLALPAARTDPVIPISSAVFVVEQLVRKGTPLDPQLSPVNLDLAGLPPTLIHVGTTEVLELDAVRLAAALASADVAVTLKHWDGQVHVFQVLGLDVLPEARTALGEIGAFVREVTAPAVAAGV